MAGERVRFGLGQPGKLHMTGQNTSLHSGYFMSSIKPLPAALHSCAGGGQVVHHLAARHLPAVQRCGPAGGAAAGAATRTAEQLAGGEASARAACISSPCMSLSRQHALSSRRCPCLVLPQLGSSSSGWLLDSAAAGGKSKGALKKSKTGVQVGPHRVVKGRLGCGLPASFNLQVSTVVVQASTALRLAGRLTHDAGRCAVSARVQAVMALPLMPCPAGCHQGRHRLGQARGAGHL